MQARYVVLANGILTTPKLARIEGMETFAGSAFHTSRWDYTVDLEGKRVGIIGTGATAVQAIPEIAKVVKSLHVFQRTPSTIDVRDQRATTPEEIETWSKEPGWARARRQRRPDLIRPDRTEGQRRLPFGQSGRLPGAPAVRTTIIARRADRAAAQYQFPDHGADQGPG